MAAGRFTTRAPPALAGISSDEGHRELAFVCAQIRNRFGAQIDQARRMAKPEELALIIAHLQREQQAETAEATRAAQATMRAQQERLRREQQGRAEPPRPLAAAQTAPPHLNFGA